MLGRIKQFLSVGFSQVLSATVVAGVAGYLVTWLVYRQVGPSEYASFAVFWSAIYLLIGGLSGIQQEVARATTPMVPALVPKVSRVRNFALAAALTVFVLIVASSPLWAEQVFPANGWLLVLPLALGCASYVIVAVLCGSLYGVAQWRSLALMIALDAVMRLLMLGVGLLLTHDLVVLAWLVALPFPLTAMLLWPLIRRGLIGRTTLDVGYRGLTWNVSRTILASASSAVLISGFPLLLGVTAANEPSKLVGELIFTITLARAPLIVAIMSMQSYFVVRFRDHASTWWQTFLRVMGLIFGAALVLAALAWWLGPPVFSWVSGTPTTVDGVLLAVLVGSSALVAALCVSGSAVLARNAHFVYSLGWVAAALLTVVVMVSPLEFLSRVAWALVLGPIAGLVVHLLWLWLSRPSQVSGDDE